MSDLTVSLKGVSKSFRRFQHPGWRALDALGLPVSKKRYDIFQALNDIDLDISRGEKVALIGRNGAGKSTLLRLISRQMKADKGAIVVNGNIQALMTLGTGFHPDFTGMQNIRSALAYQGLPATKVEECIEDIIDFTELDGFLQRPVKEYSAGMYARLAFAVATSVVPDILIIDEILGAGDAYFLGKCIQRMKALTNQGATILFVSHDISSVQMLCDRGVWIEKGRIRQDGDLLPVSKAYLASVREEEEARVRSKSMSLTRGQVKTMMSGGENNTLLRLIGKGGKIPSAPLALSTLTYGDALGLHGQIIAGTSSEHGSYLIMDPKYMNWRANEQLDGRDVFLFGNFGGRYTHGPIHIEWPGNTPRSPWVELEFRPSRDTVVMLEQYDHVSGSYIPLTEIAAEESSAWSTLRVQLNADEKVEAEEALTAPTILSGLQPLTADDRYGSGEVTISGFAFFDSENVQRHTLITGESASAILAYKATKPIADPVPVVAIYRPDGTCVMQAIASLNGCHFNKVEGEGAIRVKFDPLLLGPGDYLVSVALFKELNLASAIEPVAFDLHDRCYALKVMSPPGIHVQIGIVNQPACWELMQ
jgi:lipopolysaccharide transport system ATP-binding protein